jgi:hypothetical protein
MKVDIEPDHWWIERQLFVQHLAQERERNVALQARLDDLNAAYAKLQMQVVPRPGGWRRKRVPVAPGDRYGRLTIVEELSPHRNFSANRERVRTERRFRVRCDCGVEKEAWWGNLRTGMTKSCGCWQRDRMRTTARNESRLGAAGCAP